MLEVAVPPREGVFCRFATAPDDADARDMRLRLSLSGCAAMLLAIAVAGCAVGPDYAAPVIAVPAAWEGARATASRPAPVLPQWWRRLGDPALDALIAEAVAGNLDVASAKARIREARASRAQAVAALLPQIDGAALATRSRSGSTAGASTGNSFRGGFDASWELDLFGARDRAVEAAGYGADAAYDDLDAVLLTLVGDVASTYVEMQGYQARIALAQRTIKAQRETEALTRVRFNAGAVSAVDTARATAQVASTEAQVPSLETARAQALHRLAVLCGRAPSVLPSRGSFAGRVPVPTALPRTGIPADVLRNRPDVRKAERQLAQATAKIGQAEAQRYPAISLSGAIATSGIRFGDLSKNSAIGWSFGPTLSVPIFNGGELAAAVDVARAQRDQSDAALRLAVLTALQDVEDALVGLRQERLRQASLARAAASYGEAARLSRSLYGSGSASFLDVLDAERSLYSAEDSLLQSRVEYATRFIALNKALGAGWDRPVDVSRPAIVDVQTGPRLRFPLAPVAAQEIDTP